MFDNNSGVMATHVEKQRYMRTLTFQTMYRDIDTIITLYCNV